MPSIDIYSKLSVDTLLAGKYDASNPSGFISDAPIDGSTYARKDGAWVIASGGGWTPGSSDLDLGGYAIVNGGYAQFGSTVTSSGSGGSSVLGDDSGGSISVTNYDTTTKVTATGITFPDLTTQTTAAVAGANTGEIVAMSVVQDVTWTGSGWQVTFSPINPFLGSAGYITLQNSDGSLAESAYGAWSSTSTWTYTTTTFSSTDYVYVVAYGDKSTHPINFP